MDLSSTLLALHCVYPASWLVGFYRFLKATEPTGKLPCSAFYIGSVDLNSGPHDIHHARFPAKICMC